MLQSIQTMPIYIYYGIELVRSGSEVNVELQAEHGVRVVGTWQYLQR